MTVDATGPPRLLLALPGCLPILPADVGVLARLAPDSLHIHLGAGGSRADPGPLSRSRAGATPRGHPLPGPPLRAHQRWWDCLVPRGVAASTRPASGRERGVLANQRGGRRVSGGLRGGYECHPRTAVPFPSVYLFVDVSRKKNRRSR